MDQELRDLLTRMASGKQTNLDRAIAVLWFENQRTPGTKLTTADLCSALEAAGYAKQNRARLRGQLKKDSRTRSEGDSFGVSLRAAGELNEAFGTLLGQNPPVASDSLIPRELLTGARGYLDRIVFELNASYDQTLFNCAGVMARRLVETLIIEVFEAKGRASEVRVDGEYMMFGALIDRLDRAADIHVSRTAMRGLRELKSLGDQTAHNRRFLARKDNVDRIRGGLRTAVEELAHLAGLSPEAT